MLQSYVALRYLCGSSTFPKSHPWGLIQSLTGDFRLFTNINFGSQLVAHSKPQQSQRAPLWDQECKLYWRWELSIFIEWKTVQLKILNLPCIISTESCSWRLGSNSPEGECSVFTARLGLPGWFIPVQFVTACDKMAWGSVSLVIQILRCVRQLAGWMQGVPWHRNVGSWWKPTGSWLNLLHLSGQPKSTKRSIYP